MPKQCLICKHENSDTAIVCATCFSQFESSVDTLITDLVDINDFSFNKGDLIADRYQIVQEISCGALGILYEVKDTGLDNQKFYLKMLHPGWSSDPDAKNRFRDEISSCIDFVKPPRIQVDHLESGQNVYYYLTGPSLKQYQIERRGTVPPFSLAEIRAVMIALLNNLDYAHQYTVHNQISPETILVLGSFPNVSIRLLDFGVSNDTSASQSRKDSTDTGSLLYMAPEQVKDPFVADLRADLYSVGIILYEMVTGEEAVGAFEMPSACISDVYRPLDKVIKKILSPKADLRYSTALELSEAISSVLTEVEEVQKKLESEVNSTSRKKTEQGEGLNSLFGQVGMLHESRMLLIVFVTALLFLGGGSYILLNKDKAATDRSGSVDPTNPTDSRKKVPQNEFANQVHNIITVSATDERLPVPLTTGILTISPSPSDADIRILNIKQSYEPNMELETGRYHVEISAPGYESLTHWVDLSAEDNLNIAIVLNKKNQEDKGIFIDPATKMEFNYIKGDCYSIGQSLAEKTQLIDLLGVVKYQKDYSDETPQHVVCVDDFYMGKYEVSVKQWKIFIQETSYQTDSEKNAGGKIGCYSPKQNKWEYSNGRFWNNLGFPQSSNSPVACVSYNDVNKFIDWLNKKSDKQYRLPTEAEWEYAARGGTQSSRFWGDTVDKTACQYANVAYNKKNRNNFFLCDDGYKWSSPVGSFSANNYGMYDMLGNVWEWCSDKYNSNYYSYSPRNNPHATSSEQIYTIRGGSWDGRSPEIRAANRNWSEHDSRKSNVGFRLATQATGD